MGDRGAEFGNPHCGEGIETQSRSAVLIGFLALGPVPSRPELVGSHLSCSHSSSAIVPRNRRRLPCESGTRPSHLLGRLVSRKDDYGHRGVAQDLGRDRAEEHLGGWSGRSRPQQQQVAGLQETSSTASRQFVPPDPITTSMSGSVIFERTSSSCWVISSTVRRADCSTTRSSGSGSMVPRSAVSPHGERHDAQPPPTTVWPARRWSRPIRPCRPGTRTTPSAAEWGRDTSGCRAGQWPPEPTRSN